MWLRLRQIALVAEKLAPIERQFADVLGLQVVFRDQGVASFGLENALFPIGNQFIEVVAPIKEHTAGGRYLERRGGDGGYMFITQCDDHAPRRKRVDALGVRIVNQFETGRFRNMQLHPKDTGGTFFEIDEQLGPGAQEWDGPWEPAGNDSAEAKDLQSKRVAGIVAAEIQADDPAGCARRWSQIAELPFGADAAGNPAIQFGEVELRFVPCADGRPEGLGGLDLRGADPAPVLAAAAAIGAARHGMIELCGIRIRLV
jgi:hypothetical protein